MNSLNVLVTGGCGYIGSVLIQVLLGEGFFVTVLDNLSFRQVSILGCFGHPRFQFVKGDVCNEILMNELLKKADIIIPLAAIVGAPACASQPLLAKFVNHDAVQWILKNMSSQQWMLFPNTNSGYGVGEKNTMYDEKSPLKPISHYGKLKVAIEEEVLSSGKAISFRLATVFGISPRMRLDLLVNDFTFRACHDRFIVLFEEHFKRNYIHVRDVAGAFLFGIRHLEKMKGEAFNVGLSEANLSKRELCERIRIFVPELYIHSAAIGEDPDKRDYIVSNAKIEKLGWKPTKSLDDGIQEIVAAYPVLKASEFKNN